MGMTAHPCPHLFLLQCPSLPCHVFVDGYDCPWCRRPRPRCRWWRLHQVLSYSLALALAFSPCLQLQLQPLSPAWSSLVLALAFSLCLQLQLQPLLPALSLSVLAAAAAAVVAIGVVSSAAAVVGVGDVAA